LKSKRNKTITLSEKEIEHYCNNSITLDKEASLENIRNKTIKGDTTEHPTQKPEKLIAKLMLASSSVGDVILDPFVGSGTTSVVAKKLDRGYVGIEMDNKYCALTERRLEVAENDKSIQGYDNGVFWERNALK